MEFHLLGPVEAWADGRETALRSTKARCVLAVLLRTPGALVPTDTLVDRVWGDRLPGSSVRYKYIGWLRSALAPHGVELISRNGGYVLDVDPAHVDLHRFRRALRSASGALRECTFEEAIRLIEQGLAEWRGPAVAGLPGSWFELFRGQLERERRDARVFLARCLLDLDRPAAAVARLTEWEGDYPHDDEIVGLRVLALYRCGQHGEAAACYKRAEARMRDSLGTVPSAGLQALRLRVQARDTALDTERLLDRAALPG
ncbi:BTAD domain-containing putative transcriptional regulator [Catenulispora sp. GP43]|uniref:AfsR/SARP family transcriptional regulator n=1 Tax=Catenulispora sp. GP43 TaxID=3156263 RepID=UPI003513F585